MPCYGHPAAGSSQRQRGYHGHPQPCGMNASRTPQRRGRPHRNNGSHVRTPEGAGLANSSSSSGSHVRTLEGAGFANNNSSSGSHVRTLEGAGFANPFDNARQSPAGANAGQAPRQSLLGEHNVRQARAHIAEHIPRAHSAEHQTRQIDPPAQVQALPVAVESQDDMKVDFSCKICGERKINVLLEPCNHLVMCHLCCESWWNETQGADPNNQKIFGCPLCRTQITAVRGIHLA